MNSQRNTNIKKKKNIKKNINNVPAKKICIFHCGDMKTFKYLIKKFPKISEMKLIISYYNRNYRKILKKINNLNILHLVKVENNGMDIGPFLLCIKFLLTNTHLYNNKTTFFKFHTKSISKSKQWTISLIRDIIYCKIKNNKKPIMIGSNSYIYNNNKQVNYQNQKNIFDRNIKNNDFKQYFNTYNNEFISNNSSTNNKFTDLKFNHTFYKNYEPDLNESRYDLIKHWKKHGKNEYHRMSNVNYIKKWATKKNFFVAGTMFGFNECWLNIFKKYNLNYEYSILETGNIKNYSETNIHAWEYYFGTHTYLNNGLIKGYKNNKIKKKYKSKNNKFPIFSKINRPFSEAKIAFFLLTPCHSASSGGYRTLLNYIKFLNDNGYTVDLYFDNFINNSKNATKLKNIYGIRCGNKIKNNSNLDIIIDNINKYKVIDINKNNYYIGFECQRNYNVLIANAWQTAIPVYNNKEYANKLYYIIQDREELFYPSDIKKQNKVLETYKPVFNYYFITKYLEYYFNKKYNFTNTVSSRMGVCLDSYYNLNNVRQNSVIIPYYKNKKPGRNPVLVESIIDILSSNNIKCYIYPYSYDKKNENIINLLTMTEMELNVLYNKYKVGIIFSNSNPSRLGFEMYASGLQVIEYESEFTKYDMPDKYFTKIKNEKNILNIVQQLFCKKYDDSFKKHINIKDDYNNFLNAVLPNL